MAAFQGKCGAVAEWSKALAWKVSIRQNRIEGSNPSRSATKLANGLHGVLPRRRQPPSNAAAGSSNCPAAGHWFDIRPVPVIPKFTDHLNGSRVAESGRMPSRFVRGVA